MNVFVYSSHVLWPHHFETELEIAQRHNNIGDNVFLIGCQSELKVCDQNPEHNLLSCAKCIDKQGRGFKLLKSDTEIRRLRISDKKLRRTILSDHPFSFDNLEGFIKHKVNNFDIGYAVTSSVISIVRDPHPNWELYKEVFAIHYQESLLVYFTLLSYIEQYNPDLIYIFNGRFSISRAVIRAAEYNKINCRIHERGSDIDKYGIWENSTPHNRESLAEKMENHWIVSEQSEEVKIKIGSEFYSNRTKGLEKTWYSYTKDQENGLLPDNWNNDITNIGIFNSSEDEFAAIGPEWKNDLYESQNAGIRSILSKFVNNKDIHFYLRVHPNLKGVSNNQLNEIQSFSYPNLTVIEAESLVSSYDLMLNCDKVVTFGSSIGIEAAFWGKVSILLGKCLYDGLSAVYRPKTNEEAIELVGSPIVPLGNEDAIKYGYYYMTYGIPYEFFKATSFSKGLFRNVDMELPSKKYRILSRLYHLKGIGLPLQLFNHIYKKYRLRLPFRVFFQ